MSDIFYDAGLLTRVAASPAPAPDSRIPTPVKPGLADAAPAWDGQFWDQDKLKAAQAAQTAGKDGRTVLADDGWMAALKPLSGISVRDPAKAAYTRYGDTDEEVAATGAVYQDKLGRTYKDAGKAADGSQLIQYFQNDGGGFANPTGSKYDRVQPTYKLGSDGSATPYAPNAGYNGGSEWVKNGRDVAKMAAIAATAYFGGAALAGADMAGGVGAGALATDATGATVAQGAAGAGYGASGASTSTLGQAALSGAGKGALINGGITAARGGSLSDVLKSAAVGAATGAVGGAVSSYNPAAAAGVTSATGQGVVNGAITGGANAALTGGNVGTGALLGAASGASGGITRGAGQAVADATGSNLAGQVAGAVVGTGLSTAVKAGVSSMDNSSGVVDPNDRMYAGGSPNFNESVGLSSADRAALNSNTGYAGADPPVTDASMVSPAIAAAFQQSSGMSVSDAIAAGGGALVMLSAMVASNGQRKVANAGVASSQAAGAAASRVAADQAAQAGKLNGAVNESVLPATNQLGLTALGGNYLTAEQNTQLQQLQQQLANPATSPAARAAAQAQIQQLQKTAETAGIGLESVKAGRINATAEGQATAERAIGETDAQARLANGQTGADALDAAGASRRADQTGFYDSMGEDVKNVARQRAADFERNQTTQGNADIATSADEAQRQLLRLGGDPNKMAAMSTDIANSQQLARIGNGNQIGRTNIANLNAADDQARALKTTGFVAGTAQQYGLNDAAMSMKSSSLDAARASRTTAAQTAQGIINVGQNAATGLVNNAKDKIDASKATAQTSLMGAGANMTNAATGAANVTNGAGNVINNGVRAQNESSAEATKAVGSMTGAATTALTGKVADAGLSLIGRGIGAIGNTISDYNARNNNPDYGNEGTRVPSYTPSTDYSGTSTDPSAGNYENSFDLESSRKVKHNVKKLSDEKILDGLAAAAPKSWTYNKGHGDGKRHVGPIAEDMKKQFGDVVAPGGKAIDKISQVGLQHAAINALHKRVKKLEKRT